MKSLKFIQRFFLVLMLISTQNGIGQTCYNLNDIPGDITDYNDHTTYPAGTIIHDFGNLKIIKTHDLLSDATPSPEPTVIDGMTFETMVYTGPLTLYTTPYAVECKKLRFEISSRYIIVDGDTTDLLSDPFPRFVKDSLRIYSLGAGSFSVIGQFDSVTISNGLSQTQLSNICLNECDGTENCKTDFEFSISEDTIVDFTNLSTLGPEADFFDWYLEETTTDFENPTYTYPGEGTYEACLRIIENSCVMGGKDTICKDVVIDFSEEMEEELDSPDLTGHNTLTPNDDGLGDFVTIQPGSKIFDRTGALIVEYPFETNWTGIDAQGNYLPTGLYTILHESKTYQITLIR